MNRQFEITRLENGNLIGTGGWVREAKGAGRIYVAEGATDTTPGAMKIPLGGSGRNVRIMGFVGVSIEADIFEAIGERDFIGRLLTGWSLSYGLDGTVELSDGTNVVATADPGTVPTRGRIPCASAATAGGDGGGEYTVDLGTDTGTVELIFNANSVPDQFTVEWDGVEVIDTGIRGTDGTYDGNVVVCDGPGSGSLTFNKTTATPTTAIVRVISPYTGTAWDFILGCPADGPPPYPLSTLTDWGTFDLVATIYGEDTYNSSSTFTLTARVEKAVITMLGAEVLPLAGTAFSGAMSRVDPGQFTGIADTNWSLAIAGDGTASISDSGDVVATRPAGDLNDPSGYYTATTYGATTYNGGVVYGTHVYQAAGTPQQGRAYLLITESAPGTIWMATGPFFGPSLPSPADPVFPQELAEVTALGELVQVQDGTVIWAASGGPSIVQIGLADFTALSPPDSGTLYAITGP